MGNEMTMSAMIQNLRRLHPDIVLCGFSWNPQDTFERHGIPSFPIKRGGRASKGSHGPSEAKDSGTSNWKTRLQRYRNLSRAAKYISAPLLESAFLNRIRGYLRGLDLLVFAGTGPFTDSWGGVMGFPYSISQWTHLCRISGTKVAVVSAGAGPLNSWASKRLIGSALRQTAYRSFRDEYSKQLVEDLELRGDTYVFPDLAFSLTIPDAAPIAWPENRKDVAITGLPYRKPGRWENPNAEAYGRYLDSVAEFASWLLNAGYTVRLVPTQFRMDPEFISDLKSRIQLRGLRAFASRLVAEPAGTFEQVLAQLSKASVVVTSRFHGVVFSYLLGRPVLGISYHPKINELMKDFGQEEFCVDLSTLDIDDLRRRFRRLEANKLRASNRIQRTVGLYRVSLEEQYERLLRL